MPPPDLNRSLPDGATPVDPDEAADLIPSHIRTRGELNHWEQENILEAVRWIQRTRSDAFDEATIRGLHRRMFSKTWRWAGIYRHTDKNIGIHWPQIPEAVTNLLLDGRLWVDEGVYPVDEVALRLHHRMVQIHPFPNGNGRHARLWCDLILLKVGRPTISWGAKVLDETGEHRKLYIQALRDADAGAVQPLLDLFLSERPDFPS